MVWLADEFRTAEVHSRHHRIPCNGLFLSRHGDLRGRHAVGVIVVVRRDTRRMSLRARARHGHPHVRRVGLRSILLQLVGSKVHAWRLHSHSISLWGCLLRETSGRYGRRRRPGQRISYRAHVEPMHRLRVLVAGIWVTMLRGGCARSL